MQQSIHTCDACDRTSIGETRRDLEKQHGWHWMGLKNSLRTFVICHDCWEHYEQVWKERTAA